MTKKQTSILASIGLVLAPLIWGISFVVVKDSLDYIGPVWMIAFRYTIAFVVLAAVLVRKFSLVNKKYILHGALLGAVLFSAYFFQTVGCAYTTAGKNAFLTTVYVILVPVFAWPLTHIKPRWYTALAAVLCLTGIGLLSLHKADGSVFTMNKGDALTLVCGIFYALHIVMTARWNQSQDALLLTVLQFGFCALYAFAVAPFFDGAISAATLCSPNVIWSLLFLGLGATLVGFVLQNVGLKYVPSALASLFLSLESVFGVISGALFLHEELTLKLYIGCTLIFVSIIISEVLPHIKPRDAARYGTP